MEVTAVSLVFAACVGTDPGVESDAPLDSATGDVQTGSDAAGDGGGSIDGSDAEAGPPCDLLAPFNNPTLVANVSSPKREYGVRLSPDERTIWLGRDDATLGNVQIDIWSATRSDRSTNFPNPTLSTDLSAPGRTFHIALTADLKTAFLASNRTGTMGSNDIFVTTRDVVGARWPAAAPVANVNSTQSDYNIFVLGAGNALYFASNRQSDGSADHDLYRSKKGPSGYEGAIAISELNTVGATEESPVVTDDELFIYFRRDNTIYQAKRAKDTDAFSDITEVKELNTQGTFNTPMFLSPDRCRIYIVSDRTGGPGDRDVFMAERPKN